MTSSKEQSYETTVLVAGRWNQLPRYHFCPRSPQGEDGASCHVTTSGLDFLKEKFVDRIISRNTDHCWPQYSRNLSLLDFSVGNYLTVNMKKKQTSTIESLIVIVEDILSDCSEDVVRKIERNARKRAVVCVHENGGLLHN